MNLVKSVITIILTFVLFYLDVMEAPTVEGSGIFHEINKDIYKIKIPIGIATVLILIFAEIIITRLVLNRKRSLVNDLLNDFIKTNFHGNLGENRITVFKKTSWFTALPYFIRSTFMNSKYFLSTQCFLYRISCCPLPWRKYLIVFSRAGQPNTNKRSTFFMIPTNQNDINGFVPFVFYNGTTSSETFPDFSKDAITHYSNVDSIPDKILKKKVKEYMRKSHVKKFGRLKTIRRLSKFIWSTPMFTNSATDQSHVIVFDSESNTIFSSGTLESNLRNFTNSLSIYLR